VQVTLCTKSYQVIKELHDEKMLHDVPWQTSSDAFLKTPKNKIMSLVFKPF
jgi:hypothetical protein